jgi:hypothetical protein
MHTLILLVALADATRHVPPPKRIVIDEDERVEVATKNPDGDAIFAAKRARFGTLLKLRADFHRELLKSGE